MTATRNIFTSGRWRYAAIGIVMLALALAALFAPMGSWFEHGQKAWAASEGYIITYSLPPDAADWRGDCHHESAEECNCPYLGDAGRAIVAWAKASGIDLGFPAGRGAVDKLPAVVMMRTTRLEGATRQASLQVLAIGFTAEQVAALKDVLCSVPGLSSPSSEEATWFHVQAAVYNGYLLELFGHQFGFPENATEEDMEQQIGQWLKENSDKLPSDSRSIAGVDIKITKQPFGGRDILIQPKFAP